MAKHTVLIADNNVAFLDELADFLRGEGYSVIAAKNIEQVKAALRKRKCHAVILDVRLRSDKDEKDNSGLVLANTVPEEIPTIILTRFPTYGNVRQALAPRPKGIPAFDFVTKQEVGDLLLPVLKDAIFVRELKNGSRKAWRQLLSEEAPGVIAVCRRHGLGNEEAMRVCLEIFARLARAPGYVLRRSTRRKALINKTIFELRRFSSTTPRLRKAISQSDPTGEVFMNEQLLTEITAAAVKGNISKDQLSKQLERALENLGSRQQKVMLLYTFKGTPKADIAKQLGISEKTVARHVKDGSRRLREQIARLREEQNAPVR